MSEANLSKSHLRILAPWKRRLEGEWSRKWSCKCHYESLAAVSVIEIYKLGGRDNNLPPSERHRDGSSKERIGPEGLMQKQSIAYLICKRMSWDLKISWRMQVPFYNHLAYSWHQALNDKELLTGCNHPVVKSGSPPVHASSDISQRRSLKSK